LLLRALALSLGTFERAFGQDLKENLRGCDGRKRLMGCDPSRRVVFIGACPYVTMSGCLSALATETGQVIPSDAELGVSKFTRSKMLPAVIDGGDFLERHHTKEVNDIARRFIKSVVKSYAANCRHRLGRVGRLDAIDAMCGAQSLQMVCARRGQLRL